MAFVPPILILITTAASLLPTPGRVSRALGLHLSLCTPLHVAQGASQSLGGSAELGPLLGSGLPSGCLVSHWYPVWPQLPRWAMRAPGSL